MSGFLSIRRYNDPKSCIKFEIWHGFSVFHNTQMSELFCTEDLCTKIIDYLSESIWTNCKNHHPYWNGLASLTYWDTAGHFNYFSVWKANWFFSLTFIKASSNFFLNLKDRICILFFCHSHSHSHSALSNVYPVALESTRR